MGVSCSVPCVARREGECRCGNRFDTARVRPTRVSLLRLLLLLLSLLSLLEPLADLRQEESLCAVEEE